MYILTLLTINHRPRHRAAVIYTRLVLLQHIELNNATPSFSLNCHLNTKLLCIVIGHNGQSKIFYKELYCMSNIANWTILSTKYLNLYNLQYANWLVWISADVYFVTTEFILSINKFAWLYQFPLLYRKECKGLYG